MRGNARIELLAAAELQLFSDVVEMHTGNFCHQVVGLVWPRVRAGREGKNLGCFWPQWASSLRRGALETYLVTRTDFFSLTRSSSFALQKEKHSVCP